MSIALAAEATLPTAPVATAVLLASLFFTALWLAYLYR